MWASIVQAQPPARQRRRIVTRRHMRAHGFAISLAALVVLGLAVRLAIIWSPLGEIDGDEAVVGLMARHIAFLGERPVFYYGQPYLGSLEAFSAAPPSANDATLFESSCHSAKSRSLSRLTWSLRSRGIVM